MSNQPDYPMPTSDQLKAAAELVHSARMAFHEHPIRERFLPIVGNEHASTRSMLGPLLNCGHEALYALYFAMREHEIAERNASEQS